MSTTELREPITLAERARRGWLQDLIEGFCAGTDVPSVTAYYHARAAEAHCLTCKTVEQTWIAFTDGGHTRVFYCCPACGDSREICEPQRPRHAAPRQTG